MAHASHNHNEDNDGNSQDPNSASLITANAAPAPTTPQHPFYSLPSELILDIVDLLPPEAFVKPMGETLRRG